MASRAPKSSVLTADSVDSLTSIIEEATRSTQEGVRFFIEPAQGTLASALSKRHHLVFGRRGSGKSSLLNKVHEEANERGNPVVFVDMETFKSHSYPDVLVSVLIKTMGGFRAWIEDAESGAQAPSSLLDKVKALIGLNRRGAASRSPILVRLDACLADLEKVLHTPESVDRTSRRGNEKARDSKVGAEASVKSAIPGAEVSTALAAEEAERLVANEEIIDTYSHSKIAHLHRSIIEYTDIFKLISKSNGKQCYILMDDLYHIRADDQAEVLDFFHRICKGTNVWLKVGTIRHRTKYYVASRPPKGMKLGDDADEIDLDVTLEKYETTKQFLIKILSQFAAECKVGLADIMTDGARDRLVVASGGVARDFLTLFKRSISIARERLAGGDKSNRGAKVGAEDINKAAGENNSYKREEFNSDAEEHTKTRLLSRLQLLKEFCLTKNNTNCFLIEKDHISDSVEEINSLVDLKFVHRANTRVTLRDRKSRIYDAFMLDISEYAGERAKRELNMIQFWTRSGKDSLRKSNLIVEEMR